MKRTGKVLIRLLLLVMIVAVVGHVIAAAVHPPMDKYRHAMSGQGPGGWQYADRYDRDWDHRGFGGWHPLGLLWHLLLLIGGWKLWKRGKRGIGGVLIALALLPLLGIVFSLIIPVLLIGLAWHFIRRRRRSCSLAPEFAAEPTYSPSTAVDFLDQWESKTRRQLNNKEEQ